MEDEDPKEEQAKDEDFEEADLDEGPEEKPVEELEFEITLAIESEPEPEATYWKRGGVVGYLKEHIC